MPNTLAVAMSVGSKKLANYYLRNMTAHLANSTVAKLLGQFTLRNMTGYQLLMDLRPICSLIDANTWQNLCHKDSC
jgi:hypothetical protein